jgi:hypothetical protein
MTRTDIAGLDRLPGWDSLVAAGAVEPPSPAVLAAARTALHEAMMGASLPDVAAIGVASRGATGSRFRRAPGRPRGTPRTPRTRTRRRRLVGLGVATGAVAAALALALPAVLPSGSLGAPSPATAAAAERLAITAARAPVDRIGPGQFRYSVVAQRSVMEATDGRTTESSRIESWVAADGRRWERSAFSGGVGLDFFPAPTGDSVNYPSAQALANLPRDPNELVQYLLRRVSGSSSREEAVFVALTDLLRSGIPDAQLRASLLRAIGLLPDVGVDEHATDALGRPAVALTWTRPDPNGSDQSVLFDRVTTRVLEERSTFRYSQPPQPHTGRAVSYASTVLTTRIVAAVPPEVVRDAHRN